ncbi:MAG TPA: hypothetical protein VKT83_05625 [bacterium]|nr:hypothetical protein [bacterium]
MVAGTRYPKHVIVRGAALALIAAAFIAMSGLPAQAQVVYYYTYPPAPVYQTSCSTVSLGVLSYMSCTNPPATVYSPAPAAPVYYGYPYNNYYYPPDNTIYYSRPYYYYYGP